MEARAACPYRLHEQPDNAQTSCPMHQLGDAQAPHVKKTVDYVAKREEGEHDLLGVGKLGGTPHKPQVKGLQFGKVAIQYRCLGPPCSAKGVTRVMTARTRPWKASRWGRWAYQDQETLKPQGDWPQLDTNAIVVAQVAAGAAHGQGECAPYLHGMFPSPWPPFLGFGR